MSEIIENPPMEDLTPHLCGCKRCIIEREIDKLLGQPCECTYKQVEKTEEWTDENGITHIKTYTVTEVDVKCQRCADIDTRKNKLNKYDILEGANINESEWDNCDIVNGVIATPNVGEYPLNHIDELREVIGTEQLVQNFAIDTMMFEIIPSLESRIPHTITLMMDENTNNINLMKGLVRDMGAYFADRIIREVVTYKQCFSIAMYRKYQADTDAILRMEGYGHLIVPLN